jgi:hypothetical protein
VCKFEEIAEAINFDTGPELFADFLCILRHDILKDNWITIDNNENLTCTEEQGFRDCEDVWK